MKQCIFIFIGMLGLSKFSFSQVVNAVNKGVLYVSEDTELYLGTGFLNDISGVMLGEGTMHVSQDFGNEGTCNFTVDDEAIIRFIGTTSQIVFGSNAILTSNMEVVNSASGADQVRLYGDLHVNEEGVFNLGVINNRDFGGTLMFNSGSVATDFSDVSYVDGTVVKVGDDAFEYPIGDQTVGLRPAAISASFDVTNRVHSTYVYSNPDQIHSFENKEATIEVIDNAEYWEFIRDAGGGSVLISLTWKDGVSPQELTDNVENLHIVKWDVSQEKWIDEGGVVDVQSETVTTLVPSLPHGIYTLARVLGGNTSLQISNFFSPNNDDISDIFVIGGLEDFPSTKVNVYNRWGAMVYESDNYMNDWDFTSHGMMTIGNDILPEGVYYYVLYIGGSEDNIQKGYFYLANGN